MCLFGLKCKEINAVSSKQSGQTVWTKPPNDGAFSIVCLHSDVVMASNRPVNLVMPGSFSFDTILPPKLDINVGAHSHFFQPPKTASASSSLYRSNASLSAQDANLTTSRKRSRHNSYSSEQATPYKAPSHASPNDASCTLSALESSISMSPVPFVNTQYRLAGGLDTPTARPTMDEDGGYRTSPDVYVRGFGGFQSAPDSYFPQCPSALSRENNGRPRQHTSPQIQDGFGKAVYGMFSVAGKVWNFCRTTAFKVRTIFTPFFLCGLRARVARHIAVAKGSIISGPCLTPQVLGLKRLH